MMEKDSLLLNPDDWDYLHEGNQHLILRYVSHDENFIGKVVRLNKANPKKNGGSKKGANWVEKILDENVLLEKIESDVFGTHEVIKQYHSKKILKIENGKEFLEGIITKIEDKRPENRKGKNIDLDTSIELLLDYTFSFRNLNLKIQGYSQITVEIKPKSFLFDDVSLEQLTEILKKKKDLENKEIIESKYHHHFSRESYLKSKEKKKFTKFHKVQLKKNTDQNAKKFSHYDPHHLFTCEKDTIKKALFDLYKTPQNNLRVFIDSNPLSETEIIGFEETLKKIFEDEKILTKFVDLIAEALTSSKLLETIRDFQNLYPGTGLNLRKILSHLEKNEHSSSNENIYEYLVDHVNRSLGKDHSDDFEETIENFVGVIVKFLLSIAFRDCSMLISFHFAKKDSSEKISNFFLQNGFTLMENKDFSEDVYYKTGFIDFQMKSFEHLKKYIDNFEDLICMYWDSLE